MKLAVPFKAFDGGDLLPSQRSDFGNARPRRRPVDQHCTRTAHALTASILAAGQVVLVPKYAKQVLVR